MATAFLVCRPSLAATLAPSSSRRSALSIRASFAPNLHFSSPLRSISAYTDPSAAAPTDLTGEEIKLEGFEVGGGEGDSGGKGEGGGGGGGAGGGADGEGGSEDREEEKMGGMSMSQKLTLGYAALVGVGGVMGYMKSGSTKSLTAGLLSAFLLYYVHIQLPTKTTFASSIGLGLSAALLGVMGSRFKKSRKVFPAGVVSVVSFVMAGGYLHGILRSLHA